MAGESTRKDNAVYREIIERLLGLVPPIKSKSYKRLTPAFRVVHMYFSRRYFCDALGSHREYYY